MNCFRNHSKKCKLFSYFDGLETKLDRQKENTKNVVIAKSKPTLTISIPNINLTDTISETSSVTSEIPEKILEKILEKKETKTKKK